MKGRTRVKVKGLNQERIINKLIKSFKIYNFKRIEYDVCEFEVDYFRRHKLEKSLKEEGLEILSLSNRGILDMARRLFTSYGVIAALVICVMFYIIQYNFILKIDVLGVNNGEKKEISKFVENKLDSRLKFKIQTVEVEGLIKNQFQSVSSVSVAIIGQSLVINVNPSVIPNEFNESGALISGYDGIITDINLVQGTLAVDIGSIVKKGDILVYPFIIDSQGQERKVKAKADIIADIWLEGSEVSYDYQLITRRTGKSKTLTEVWLYDYVIYSNNVQIDFKEYEKEEKSVYISKNNLLPLKRKSTTYYQTMTEEVISNFDEIKEQIIEKAKKKALIFLQKNEIIKEEHYTIKEDCGRHEVKYLLTVSRNLGG